jgi:type II secretory pathway pseudopilin PulG
LTLVELLVSLGVIVLIALAFGAVLGQTQKVVSSTQGIIRANSAASAIAQVIRDDFLGLSKEGFLMIGSASQGFDQVYFTVTGTFTSKKDSGLCANAALIDYGRTNDDLWRRARLFMPPGAGSAGDTISDMWLGRFRYDRVLFPIPPPVSTSIQNWLGNQNLVNPPTFPVQYNAGNLGDLWPLLGERCERFTIQWLDAATSQWLPSGPWAPYRQIWTYDDIDNPTNPNPTNPWPKAVKVTFQLRTGEKATDTMDYEVICSIRD